MIFELYKMKVPQHFNGEKLLLFENDVGSEPFIMNWLTARQIGETVSANQAPERLYLLR